jgi:hypothetical protein
MKPQVPLPKAVPRLPSPCGDADQTSSGEFRYFLWSFFAQGYARSDGDTAVSIFFGSDEGPGTGGLWSIRSSGHGSMMVLSGQDGFLSVSPDGAPLMTSTIQSRSHWIVEAVVDANAPGCFRLRNSAPLWYRDAAGISEIHDVYLDAIKTPNGYVLATQKLTDVESGNAHYASSLFHLALHLPDGKDVFIIQSCAGWGRCLAVVDDGSCAFVPFDAAKAERFVFAFLKPAVSEYLLASRDGTVHGLCVGSSTTESAEDQRGHRLRLLRHPLSSVEDPTFVLCPLAPRGAYPICTHPPVVDEEAPVAVRWQPFNGGNLQRVRLLRAHDRPKGIHAYGRDDGAGAQRWDSICHICFDKPKSVLFFPCRHFVCCGDCAVKLAEHPPRTCPMCRLIVQCHYDVTLHRSQVVGV